MTEQYKDIEIGNLLFGHSRGDFPVDREMAQPLFGEFFGKHGIDSYGYPDKGSPLEKTGHRDGEAWCSVDTDVFSIHPYFWGDDEAAEALPNFLYKPENIEIRWYKYMMRDAYSNVDLSEEKTREMLAECEKSIDALGGA